MTAIALAVFALAAPPRAQQVTASRTVLATVVDGNGRPQVDVGADDFVVQEDGDDRDVLDVHVADYPIVLLVDDGVTADAMKAIRTALARFIARIGERPVAIGTLSRPDQMAATLENDRLHVLASLSALSAGEPTPQSTMSSVAHAARMLQESGASFSAIVVATARRIDATQLVQGDLLPGIIESGASVHVVSDQAPVEDGLPGDAPDLLRVLSEQTHGQYTTIFSFASFGIALDRLADRLATEMMVEYLVPAGGATGEVRVGVRRAGARVLGLGVK